MSIGGLMICGAEMPCGGVSSSMRVDGCGGRASKDNVDGEGEMVA